ncbi:MAG: thioredoxin-dependent peroxiredoxin [Pseudomonadota bacterium]|nr:thioredoxin-dependent peroxiredoxin [Pseudomonadota bacterium]
MQNVTTCTYVATNQLQGSLEDYIGHWLILYFYPKDATPGCTQEGRDFRDMHNEFFRLNTKIFGISRDSLAYHDKFKQKEAFPFELISDTSEDLCQRFQVIKEKNMYGKKVLGIERSTFIINPKGEIAYEWRGVKVPGHVEMVLQQLQKLQQNEK